MNLFAQQTPERYTKLQKINPAKAKELLKDNWEDNRNVSPAVVEQYAQIMLKGEWVVGPSVSLSIDWNGRMFNGQHRMHAVIKANIPIDFYIDYNCDPKEAEAIDCGKPRTLGDRAKIKGSKLNNNLLSVFKHMIIPSFWTPTLKSPRIELLMTPNERIDFAEKYLEQLLKGRNHKGLNKISSAALGGAIARASLFYPSRDIDDFIFIIRGNLDQLSRKTNINTVQKLVAKFYNKEWKSNLDASRQTIVQLACSQNVLWHYLNGKKLTEVEPSYTNLFPVPELDTFAQQVRNRNKE